MSIRYWLYALVLGGCLSLGAFGGANADHHPHPTGSENQRDGTNTQSNRAPEKETGTQNSRALVNQERCLEAEDAGIILNECQQREIAIAANRQADATDELLRLTNFEIWLLAGTLGLSAGATIVAICAVRVTSKTAKAQLRAYIVVTDIILEEADSEFVPTIQVGIKNVGQTPAYRAKIRYKYSAMRNGKEDFSFENLKFSDLMDIGPDRDLFRQKHIDPNQWGLIIAHIKTGNYTLIVYGECVYFDAFKVRRETKFRFYLPTPNGFPEDGSLAISREGNTST
ncbi:hypothetical protein [Nisaea sp.]|uniref:hypothetical protein n=1 Tax=Nisaea sp. TaxID=2024842 RepID=UPI0032EEC004